MNEQELAALVAKALQERLGTGAACAPCASCAPVNDMVPIGISNRHIHLKQEDFEVLFGQGATMTHLKDLSQPGQFACKELMTIVGPKGAIENVRLLGPARKQTQVEVSAADCFKLGVSAPLRDSGDLAGSAPITIVGPKGTVSVSEGCIIAVKHIHMHTSDAARLGLKDKDRVDVRTNSERGVIFLDVLIRVSDKFQLEMHVDMDEANAAALKNGDMVQILPKK